MRTSVRLCVFPLLAALCMMFGTAAVAQYENGSIVGTVRDASGAVVPNAQVTVTNLATSAQSVTKSGAQGEYDIAQLRAGNYSVRVNAEGFAEAAANNVTVSVGNRQRIDLTVSAGATQTVEVTDVALQVESESSQRDQVITNIQTAGLPIINRNYSDLLGLVAGVRQAPTAASTTSNGNSLIRQGAYNVNGQRSVFNNFLLDGMDNNSYGESNQGFDNQIIAVPPDSVSQLSVVTNNESAEYGRSSGATVNVATQQGGNRYHAILYDFLRNTALNAPGFFKPLTGAVPFRKPIVNRNQFGMNFGGPIVKDRLFFFLDYEGLRSKTSPLFVLTLPTQNELNGVLVVPVRNPVTGQYFAANTAIPQTAFNPLSIPIVNAFKSISGLPGSGSATQGYASSDYSVQIPFTDNGDKGDLRLDYVPNDTSRYFVRISDRKEKGTNFPTIPLPLEGQTAGAQRILDQQVAAGYTRLFGANRILDLRLGVSRTKAGKTPLSEGTTPFNIPGLPTGALSGGLPAIGITNFSAFGRQTTNPQFQNPSLLDPKVNYTWVKGNHSLKFGYEYEKVWMGVLDNNPLYGSFTFGGGYSLCNATNSPGQTACAGGNTSAVADNYWADFLFGNTSAYSLANFFEAHLRETLQSAYAQDDWRVSPKLTLNLGLRWEYGSPYSEQNNYVSNFDPTTQTVLTLSPGAVAGNGITPTSGSGTYGKTLVNPDLNDFAPRVGFAFAPTDRMSVRGGFGLSYVHYTRAGSGDILPINAPQAQFASVTQATVAANTPSAATHCTTPLPAQIVAPGSVNSSCYATADQGFPTGLATTFNPATDNITYIPRNTRDSYVESYFLSVQQQLYKNTVLDIAYVGNHGLKLQGFLNANQRTFSGTGTYSRPYANFADITEALNEFYSNYNSLQVKYEQRFTGGLTFLNSFTWEHSLDNASASLEGNTPAPQDGTNIAADYSQSDYNLPIINVTSLVDDLPFGRGRRFGHDMNPVLDAVVGGWQVSLINTAQAGTPFNILYTPSSANQVSPLISANYRGANAYRPNRIPGQPLTLGRSTQVANTGYFQYINLAALQLPATRGPIVAGNTTGPLLSPFGNLGRNPARTPAFYETDLDLNKRFSLPVEGLKLEFRSELYNLFNHTNLYLPSSTVTGTLSSYNAAGAFVNNSPTGGGLVSSTFQPRVVQFALKLIY